MKRILTLAVCVLMLAGMMCITTSATRGYTYYSVYGTPEIDGVKDDIWNAATLAQLVYTSSDNWQDVAKATPMTKYYFSVMNDDEFIYLLFEAYDFTPGEDDMMEFHIDEDFCQKPGQKLQEEYPDYNFCPCAYHLGAMFADPDITLFGCRGGETYNEDGSPKDIIIECKGTQTPMTISEGACEYRILELKIKPVRPITEGAVYGIEASFDDKDEDGEWVNFLRWNTDENSTYDVKDGWPEGVIDEYEGQGQWPYWSTYTYAPCYLASAPAEDEPASEEPASEKPASEEPASEEPASEEPASEPATQGSNTQPPKTADAGIVVAAVVMAAAAAVVLRKKH